MSRILLPGPQVTAQATPVLSHRVGVAGVCADSADDKWFPAEPGPSATGKARAAYEEYARAACSGCTVLMECRELALRIEGRPRFQAHGVWGGLAPWERDALRRRRRERARRAAGAVAS